MSAPRKQPIVMPARFAQSLAVDPIAQLKRTSSPKAHPEPEEVPIGVLEVPLFVWGSRRTGSNMGPSELVDLFTEETCTVIVFPHGAVIRLSATVTPGQRIVVVNRKSGQITLCQVANVRTYPHVRGYAEIEFMQSATGFWGSYIPQGTLKLTARPAENLCSDAFPREVMSVPESAIVASPIASPFVMPEAKSIENREIQVPFAAKSPESVATITALRSHFANKETVSNHNPRPIQVSARDSAHLSSRRLLDWFWGGLNIRIGRERTVSSKRRIPLVPIMATLCLLAAVGILLLRYGTAKDSEAAQSNAMPQVSIGSLRATGIEIPEPQTRTRSTTPHLPVAKTENFPGNQTHELGYDARLSRSSGRKPTSPKKFPTGRLLAPRSATNRALGTGRDVPPDVTGNDLNTGAGAIQGLIARLQPSGGRAKEAQLLSNSAPNYPPSARQAHIEGQVTIEAVIDTTGKLTNMKVVSGPSLLRQAALDSLRTWKYQPAYLNEKPVPVKTSINVNFHLH